MHQHNKQFSIFLSFDTILSEHLDRVRYSREAWYASSVAGFVYPPEYKGKRIYKFKPKLVEV